ncbi:MAG: hypothetical protein OEU74_02900 [Gammaproteobacteria bacterium]|nr:hypothetical protein [Gammaproteobacteria bacterium]
MFRYLIFFMLTVFLTGCATTTNDDGRSYIYKIPAGTNFVLKKDISIPARSASVLLQDGKIAKSAQIDQYAPTCRFEVNKRGEQTIKPGTFTVTKVKQDAVYVMRGVLNYIVKFELKASDPNIRSLTCGAWGDTTSNNYITVPQMQQALGAYFETPTL